MDISAHVIYLQNKASTVDRQYQPVILNSQNFSSSIYAIKRHYIAILTASNTKLYCCLLRTNTVLNIASLLGRDACSLEPCLYCNYIPMHTASYVLNLHQRCCENRKPHKAHLFSEGGTLRHITAERSV
jgi:hypothetical protein